MWTTPCMPMAGQEGGRVWHCLPPGMLTFCIVRSTTHSFEQRLIYCHLPVLWRSPAHCARNNCCRSTGTPGAPHLAALPFSLPYRLAGTRLCSVSCTSDRVSRMFMQHGILPFIPFSGNRYYAAHTNMSTFILRTMSYGSLQTLANSQANIEQRDRQALRGLAMGMACGRRCMG